MELNSDKFKNTVENVVKTTGLLGILLYATGMIITCFEYAQYGITAIDFLSPRYILTGGVFYLYIVLALSLNVFIYLGSAGGKLSIDEKPQYSKSKQKFVRISHIGLFLLIWFFYVGWVSYWAFHKMFNSSVRLELILFSLAVIIVAAALIHFVSTFLKTNILKQENISVSEPIANGYWMFFLLTFIILYSVIYTHNLYPLIPESLGGGRLSNISLFANKDNYTYEFKGILNLCDSTKQPVKRFPLIKETTFEYYLLLSDSSKTVIQIPKRIVQGAIIIEDY